MSDNSTVSCVLNAVLCGATGFCVYKIGPLEHPYVFSACLIGLTHGVLGLVSSLAGNENAKKIQEKTAGIVEIVPLPLVNVDFFLSAQSNNIALGHGLFIVPLTVTVILGLWNGDMSESYEEGDTLQTLMVLTILGNITALVYLAVNESSWQLGGMALLAFLAKFAADLSVDEGSYEPISYVSWSAFFVVTALSVSGEK